MISVTPNSTIFVAVEPVDFRKQADGLIAHCCQVLKSDPRSGTFFVFSNRAKTMIRVLVYDQNGYWVMTKRLTKGRFLGWPSATKSLSSIAAKDLMRMLRNPPTSSRVSVS